MNDHGCKAESEYQSTRRLATAAALSVALLWIAQPPVMFSPAAFVALVPWLRVITSARRINKRGYLVLGAISAIYYLVSLQGLRHAHPLMFIPWIALGCYLAVYHVLFIAIVRQAISQRIPLLVAVPVVWVGQECLRNYLITGISALMLGHTMADVPQMIQIADLLGSYGVSFVVALGSVAVHALIERLRRRSSWKETAPMLAVPALVVVATLTYGSYRMGQPLGPPLATFALIQRDEPVDYGQSIEHEVEIFRSYARQSVDSIRAAGQAVDAVVWPESMFSGGMPWMIAGTNAKVPGEVQVSDQEFRRMISERRKEFRTRAGYVQDAIAQVNPSGLPPHLIVGCGVVRYDDTPNAFSGIVSIEPDGNIADWYGKTHLVMFGEYIPIAPHIFGLRSLVPPGMGLQTGPGAKSFQIDGTSVSPNICIETAVERVIMNQLATFTTPGEVPQVVVTVTNDGWFDDSSVIDHHLRCAQLVAAGSRRPILSAANNGPTAWIDSRGHVVERLASGTNGAVIAAPQRDERISLYLRIGDWPARICTLLCGLLLAASAYRARKTQARSASE